MKYTSEVTINLPRTRVVQLFDNTENLYQWQPGLKHFRVISGDPGKDGCRSELVYEGSKGELRMIETITSRNLPEEFHGIYEVRGFRNKVYNQF